MNRLISLNNQLFTIDPDTVFSKKRGVKIGLLDELHRRQKLYEFPMQMLIEFYHLTTKKNINRRILTTYLKRVDVYRRAKVAIEQGAKEVTSDFFGENKDFVIERIYKTNSIEE